MYYSLILDAGKILITPNHAYIKYGDTIRDLTQDTDTVTTLPAALRGDYGTPLEISKYIDFHEPGTNVDYNTRLHSESNWIYCNGIKLASINDVSSAGSKSYDFSKIAVGRLVKFNNDMWRCVHFDGSLYYLASHVTYGSTIFGSNNTYAGSTLASVAAEFVNNIADDSLTKCNNVTVNGVTSKVFVPSYDQVNGGFSWLNSNEHRALFVTVSANSYNGYMYWWTSSPSSGSDAYCVLSDGRISNFSVGNSYGFRPFVAVWL